jgi:hypothetical protein
MASITGQLYVPAPNPITPRYGLFQVATGPLDLPTPARLGGVQYEIATCQLPLPYTVACQTDRSSKTLTATTTTVTGSPFVVYSAISCSMVGLTQERLSGFLMDQLRAGEQAVVENAFSSSSNGIAPGLANNPAVVNLGTAVDVISATGQLEAWLYARYGIPGIIHVPARAAAYFSNAYIIEKDQRIWRTDMGTAVSFGNYAGQGPTGQVPATGTTWVYITGQMAVWRTPDGDLFSPPIGEVLNRATNVVTSVMEREYVISFDCFVAAILVTLDSTAT